MPKSHFNLNKRHGFFCLVTTCNFLGLIGTIIPNCFHNEINTSITWLLESTLRQCRNPIIQNPQWSQYTCQFYLSIKEHITSLPVMHIPFPALFFSLDVLHPITPSANSIPSTNSSHPTQGRYQTFMYLLCAIQGALSLFFSLDVPPSQHSKC